ncbi:SafA/ExsA family spore coat assembly protein [Lentibacillus cibarius]|uniref:SafA/ExsA family spore coat assembly protein n=1 Tax=Lentibacillus cibarius TaxID=2583219 RepID=A0A549YLQ6_9BACI|nr:SafA/ExsA family spore coat assembly protein [Lentibacillus cibarius]TRM12821.1 SafA/ExsA family spore coat assembly protein [Lentibacillus cibarius]
MKIHIVQKGDTLWEIAKQYNADFEQVKEMNPQLSSPDMIMPGMKIKIPSSSKPVKAEKTKKKEMQKPEVEKPYKDTSPKPKPVEKEDDVKPPKPVEPKMPIQQQAMQVPIEQEMNHYTTINLPQVPSYTMPEQAPTEKPKPMPYQPKPMPPKQPHYTPTIPQPPVSKVEPYSGSKPDCGCGGKKPAQQPMYQQPMYKPMPQQPMCEQPMYKPMPQQPMCEQPIYKPMPQQPMCEHPMYKPMPQQPMYQQPVHKPMPQQPIYQQPMHKPMPPFSQHDMMMGSSSCMEKQVKSGHYHSNDCYPHQPYHSSNMSGLYDSYYQPKPQLTNPHVPDDHFSQPMPPGYRDDHDDTLDDESVGE